LRFLLCAWSRATAGAIGVEIQIAYRVERRRSKLRIVAKKESAPQLGGWRERTLERVRTLIMEADPGVIEERKWRKPSNKMAGIPVWSCHGIICTGETYKDYIKLTFARGASLPDPSRLFNAGFGGGTRRAIDIREGDQLNGRAFKALVKAAIAANGPAPAKKKATGTVTLLSGGNPQIAKADGDAPVQAYIAAMPGWKRAAGARLDAAIVKAVPTVKKAVKWNSPFYGVEGQGWFLSFHVFARYIKVTFFRGASLTPLPPVVSKDKNVRYVHIEEGGFDEAQFARWVKQAAALPGWMT
jgi:hypothetical protein